ncbi:MAG: hypothetical protein IPN27_09860 [Cellvibrionales bacterium]|nr:hypothetical protein [Cellvibrionales bacterium]
MNNTRALPLFNERIRYFENRFRTDCRMAVVAPLRGSRHRYKYRLAYVVNETCVLRYDNENGKGDHRHYGEIETNYVFTELAQLLTDFAADITRWNRENNLV